MKNRVYYAHSKMIYDTPREKKERAYIEKKFKGVCCPNRDIGELLSIDLYLDVVRRCKTLVCSEYQKHIGRGVFLEIEDALKENKKVFCLRKNRLYKVDRVQVVDDGDWKVCYGKVKIKE